MWKTFCHLVNLKKLNYPSYTGTVINPIINISNRSLMTKLCNGVKVITENKDVGLVTTSLFVRVGSRFEDPCNNGITNYIGHLAYKGFTNMSKNEFENQLYCKGIKFSVKTTRDYQVFTAESQAHQYEFVINMLCAVMTCLELSDEEMEYARDEVFFQMKQQDDDPEELMFEYLHHAAFHETSMGLPVLGNSYNLACFSREQIRQFMCCYYHPSKMVLSVSGGVAHDDIVRVCGCTFGRICLVCVPIDSSPYRYTGSAKTYRNDDLPFAHTAIAFEAPAFMKKGYIELMTASEAIGTWRQDQGGLINDGLVCKSGGLQRLATLGKFCEYYRPFYLPYGDIGLWGIYFMSDKMNIDDMVIAIQSQWMRLCTTFTSAEMERAARNLCRTLCANVLGSTRAAFDNGLQVLYREKKQDISDTLDLMNCVDNFDIRETCMEILYDRCPVVAAVGPIENLPNYVRIRSGMYWLRL